MHRRAAVLAMPDGAQQAPEFLLRGAVALAGAELESGAAGEPPAYLCELGDRRKELLYAW